MNKLIKDYISLDNIDENKFQANLELLKNESLEIYRSNIKLTGQRDLISHFTPTIYKFAALIDRPLGHEDWFIAAYPDVVKWLQNTSKEKLIEILDKVNASEREIFNQEAGKFKLDFLRKLIGEYKKVNKLECT